MKSDPVLHAFCHFCYFLIAAALGAERCSTRWWWHSPTESSKHSSSLSSCSRLGIRVSVSMSVINPTLHRCIILCGVCPLLSQLYAGVSSYEPSTSLSVDPIVISIIVKWDPYSLNLLITGFHSQWRETPLYGRAKHSGIFTVIYKQPQICILPLQHCKINHLTCVWAHAGSDIRNWNIA